MSSIKNLLMLSTKQRKLCRQLKTSRERLFRMAYAWSHNAKIADKIVQEATSHALNSINNVKNIEEMDRWMFHILSICFIDYYKNHQENIDIKETMPVNQNATEEARHQHKMFTSVRSGISGLPFPQRQVITLVDIEDFTYADIANILDISPGTVMSRLSQARQSLKIVLNNSKNKMDNKTRLRIV